MLDDVERIATIDSQNMLKTLREFPEQIEKCWAEVQRIPMPEKPPLQVVILGMGGSGVGGDLVCSLAREECPVPVIVHRDYELPRFVGEDTLVVAASYSGDTEETLCAFRAAKERGAQLFVVATGGQLLDEAYRCGVPRYCFDYQAQPRAALGYLFTPILSLFKRLNFLGISDDEVEQAIELLREQRSRMEVDVPLLTNPCKQLAQDLAHYIPVIFGSERLSAVARRWKTQINENAKTACYFEELPELCHNSVEGLKMPVGLKEHIFVVILRSRFLNERNQLRQEVVMELLQQHKIPYRLVSIDMAPTPLSEILLAIQYGDYTSYYLSILHGLNPSPVENIDFVKDKLNKVGR